MKTCYGQLCFSNFIYGNTDLSDVELARGNYASFDANEGWRFQAPHGSVQWTGGNTISEPLEVSRIS